MANFKQGIISPLILLILITTLSSCYKETINTAPRIVNYTISPEYPKAGDSISITIQSTDYDNDDLFYNWRCQSGTIISGQKSKTLTCKLPYREGDFCCSFELSDRKAIVDQDICVPVDGYIFEDFAIPDPIWSSETGLSEYPGEFAKVSAEGDTEGLFSFSFPEKIKPPYAVFMSVSLDTEPSSLTSGDKYGLLLDFFNVGSDTLAKAVWFRIYPQSNVKNWKLSLYKDVGSSGAWQNLDPAALGISEFVKTEMGIYNHIKMEVLENNEIKVYVDENLIYSSSTLTNNFLSNGIAPKLILDKVAARTSAGSINIDNVYVTQNMELNFNDIFN